MSRKKLTARIERRHRLVLFGISFLVAPIAALILYGAVSDLISGSRWMIRNNAYMFEGPVGPLLRLLASAILLISTSVFIWRLIRARKGDGE